MQLIEIKEGRAFVSLEPSDCIMLSKLCGMAVGELPPVLDAHMATIARIYDTALQALAIAVVSPGFVSEPNIEGWMVNMKDLDLMPLLQESEPVLMTKH